MATMCHIHVKAMLQLRFGIELFVVVALIASNALLTSFIGLSQGSTKSSKICNVFFSLVLQLKKTKNFFHFVADTQCVRTLFCAPTSKATSAGSRSAACRNVTTTISSATQCSMRASSTLVIAIFALYARSVACARVIGWPSCCIASRVAMACDKRKSVVSALCTVIADTCSCQIDS